LRLQFDVLIIAPVPNRLKLISWNCRNHAWAAPILNGTRLCLPAGPRCAILRKCRNIVRRNSV